MRLLIIITDLGSFNNFLSELALKMIQLGHSVDVICSNNKVININDKDNFTDRGINIHFVDFPRGYNIYKQYKASIQIYGLAKKINPNLVHVHFTTGIFTTILFKKLPFYTIGTFHGLGFTSVKGIKRIIFKLVEYFCFSRLDQVWVLNNFDLGSIKGRIKNKVYKLDTAGVGCDLSKFDINSKIVDKKNELNIRENDFVITYTGRFVNFKGFGLVIKSFLKLNKLHPFMFKLVLIGGYDPIHPTGLTKDEEEEFLSCIDIIRVGFTNEVETYLSISDVFLFPSLKEGMPVCIIEALAMGLPVITADSRGCNDLVVNEQNGVLLSSNPSVDEIIKAIIYLKNSPLLIDKIKKHNIENRWWLSRNVYVEKQIEVYQNILNI